MNQMVDNIFCLTKNKLRIMNFKKSIVYKMNLRQDNSTGHEEKLNFFI